MLTDPPTVAEIREIVHAAVVRVLQDRNLPVPPIAAEDKLNATLGLRSLDLAQLVFDLETTLGGDPFEELVPITSVRTVGDLVDAYALLGSGRPPDREPQDDLRRRRASSERRRRKRGVEE